MRETFSGKRKEGFFLISKMLKESLFGSALGQDEVGCCNFGAAVEPLERGGSAWHQGQLWKADGVKHRDKRASSYPK